MQCVRQEKQTNIQQKLEEKPQGKVLWTSEKSLDL